MSLPQPWVEKLFERLHVRYGGAWRMMWEGMDMTAVRADWANRLAGFEAYPESLAWGLEHLPVDRPPTVEQFAQACNRAPVKQAPALPAPKADPAVVQKVLEAFKPATSAADRLAWAHRLREREAKGDRLTPAQRSGWREALRAAPDPATEGVGAFTTIPPETLPPGMREAA